MNKSLKVVSSIDNLKNIRDFVSQRLQELSISELEINMMVLAVDEICANLILHSDKGSDEIQQIEITVKDQNQGVVFEIKDKGEPFDVNSYEVPDIDEIIKSKRKGGLGLMLVKKIMDKIELTKDNDYTILRLFKKVSLANHSA